MKKLFLVSILALLLESVCFSADYENIIAKTAYTAQEKARISVLFKNAAQNSLPVDLLANKLKEAMMKKVAFPMLLQVMEKRLAMMLEASAVIAEKKMTVKNRQYALQLITELHENGVKRDVYERMIDAGMSGAKNFDDMAKYFHVLGKYHSGDIAGAYYADILAACINKNISPERGEKLLYLLTEAKRGNMPLDAAKTIIMNGIARNMRLDEIGDEMQLRGVPERHLPGDASQERERDIERMRGFPADDSRRRNQQGGNGIGR